MSESCVLAPPATASLNLSAVRLPPCTSIARRILKHPRAMHYNRLVAFVLAVNVGYAVYAASIAGWWTSTGTDLPAVALAAQANLAAAVAFRQ